MLIGDSEVYLDDCDQLTKHPYDVVVTITVVRCLLVDS